MKREYWLDYLRSFACILVTLGHMFMGLRDAGICTNTFVSYGIDLIYHFHVYIFFFCSGYLLQKNFEKISSGNVFMKNKILRCIDFVVVYIIFTGVTFLVKVILSNSVNSPNEYTFFQTLFDHPINQMWYLYAIAVITLFTPMLRGKRQMIIILSTSILLKIVVGYNFFERLTFTPLKFLCSNQIWYVLGCVWAHNKFVPKKSLVVPTTALFILGSTWIYFEGVNNYFINTLLTLLGISATASFFYICIENKTDISEIWKIISEYMLQIYLLHTICAAGIRIILVKIGITSVLIHIGFGIVFSFGIPILVGIIVEKTKILNIFFYPSKTIKQICKI